MMISKITKKDINKLFWRSMCVNASFNYERHMSKEYNMHLVQH